MEFGWTDCVVQVEVPGRILALLQHYVIQPMNCHRDPAEMLAK